MAWMKFREKMGVTSWLKENKYHHAGQPKSGKKSSKKYNTLYGYFSNLNIKKTYLNLIYFYCQIRGDHS